jgi:transcriptional regulator NrdR family protein
MKWIIKRDGRRKKFNSDKIEQAIINALMQTNEKVLNAEGSKLVKHITERVEDELDKLYTDKKTCTVAEVQDVLEKMMMRS